MSQLISKSRLSFLDRFLSLWIFLAMALGIIISLVLPQSTFQSQTIQILLAIGLILMIYPPLAKVQYSELGKIFKDPKSLVLSIVQNWLIGPILMTTLALIFLWDKPDYMVGLILIGLARCIAMVIVWNDLAKGNREYCTALVSFNSLFQILFFTFYAWLFVTVVPPLFGLQGAAINIDIMEIAKNLGLYLGVPMVLGFISWAVIPRISSQTWFREKFLKKISPLTLIALLFTIVLLFSSKGGEILNHPLDLVRISIPLVIYFIIMFAISVIMGKNFKVDEDKTITLAFTAASNNFELAIAVSIGIFGIGSNQTLAAVIGPLIEVPIMLLLVKITPKLLQLLKKEKGSNE